MKKLIIFTINETYNTSAIKWTKQNQYSHNVDSIQSLSGVKEKEGETPRHANFSKFAIQHFRTNCILIHFLNNELPISSNL